MEEWLALRKTAEDIEARLGEIAERIAAELSCPASEGGAQRITGLLRNVEHWRRDLQNTIAQYDAAVISPQMRRMAGLPAIKIRAWTDTQRYFRTVRHRILRWRDVARAVNTLAGWQGMPLYGAEPDTNSLAAQQRKSVDDVFKILHGFVNTAAHNEAASAFGCFADIPLPATAFAEHAHAAMRVGLAQHRARVLRFIDVGCGGGLKVLQAAQFYAVSDGLDYDPGYVAAARHLFEQTGHVRGQVFEGDARQFPDYAGYDVIYFYRPMKDADMMHQLEDRILDDARPGTVLIAPYAGFAERLGSLNCAHVAGAVFVAGIDRGQADDLRLAAERIVPELAPLPLEADPLGGYLTPILEASYANAYPIR